MAAAHLHPHRIQRSGVVVAVYTVLAGRNAHERKAPSRHAVGLRCD
jgi:hypothetical protein